MMVSASNPRVALALDELRRLIADRYPTAVLTVTHGYDPEGIYLTATVDVDDADEVTTAFIDRLLDMQIEDELSVYVIPIETADRLQAGRRAQPLPFAAAGNRP